MAVPNQYTAPNATEYGGDEVSAIVLDPGYSVTRAGFAGEDVPKSIVPTFYGVHTPNASSEPSLLFGENSLHNPIANLDIKNPLADGGKEEWVEDWDAATKLWEYSITSRLTTPRQTSARENGQNDGTAEGEEGKMDVDMDATEDLEKPMADNPLLMSEPGKTTQKSREKIIEIAMENWGIPAFWLGRSGALAAFSAGKASALVIDIGASMMQVTPVIDGMILKKGVRVSPLAGNFISNQIRHIFTTATPPVPLLPHYLVKAKVPVDANLASQATYRTFEVPPMYSFRAWEEERVLTEFKESVVQVWDGPGRLNSGTQGQSNIDVARNYPGRPFEMPDGWNTVFGVERLKIAEGLFDHTAVLGEDPNTTPKAEHTIPHMVRSAIESVDVDSRPLLLNNVVLVGGSSLLQGLTRRLDAEVNGLFPGPRVRLNAPSATVERKFASWLGGSILGSLGTFHQNWISRKEYEEHGPGIVEKRCK